MPRPRFTSLFRLFGMITAILMVAISGLGASALATDTPGNNGTVKIHEGAGENDPGEVRNEPHVCTFHLHFYFADPEQAGTWEIEEWAPTGDKATVALSGTYDTAGDGEDRQPAEGVYTLPDGHYKLFWDGDLDTAKHDKMKVFWVDCAPASESPSPTGSEQPIETGSVSPSESASESPPGSPSESASESASPTGSELPAESESASPSASESPTGSELPAETSSSSPTGGVEAVTGTPAGITPPPTDTGNRSLAASNDGWRIVLLGIAALIATMVVLVPSPATFRARGTRSRRGR